MERKWINVKEQLPENEQEILTYYYDHVSERDQISLLTYFEKDAVMYSRIDRNQELSKAKRMLNTIFDKSLEVKAEQEGFYIFEWDNKGDTTCRRHADIITHWQALPEPPKELV